MEGSTYGSRVRPVSATLHNPSLYYAPTRVRPVCPTCTGTLGDKEESYKRLLEQGFDVADALTLLGLKRPCCRARMMSPVVFPVSAFVMPGGIDAYERYMGFKPRAPEPNLVVAQLRANARGLHIMVSHVASDGSIGIRPLIHSGLHVGSEVVLHGERDDYSTYDMTATTRVRLHDDPGEVESLFPYHVYTSRPGEISGITQESFFDLSPEEQKRAVDEAPIPMRLSDFAETDVLPSGGDSTAGRAALAVSADDTYDEPLVEVDDT